jgi:CRP-like cAMP-binding protein
LEILSHGSSLGALSLMAIGSRQAAARADSDCELLVLTRADFLRLAEDSPRAACRLAEAVVAELSATLRPQLAPLGRAISGCDVDTSA